MALGAVLARELDADLDVVLSRKLRAPYQPELALGAISENGAILLNEYGRNLMSESSDYLTEEREHQPADYFRGK